MTEQQQTKRGDGHLVVYLAWPVLIGLAVAVVGSLSIGGVVGILGGTWAEVGTVAGVVFFVAWGLSTGAMLWYVVGEWSGPRAAERVRYAELEPLEPEIVENTRFIPLKPRGITRDAPQLPAGANRATIREGFGAAVDLLARGMKRRQGVTTMPAETQTLAPTAAPWVCEFYNVLMGMWSQKLTRANFERTFTGGQALYKKYVAGTGTMRSQRGLWDTWGVIERGTDGRGTWAFCHDLPTILSLDPDLQAYASERAGMVEPSPSKSGTPEKTVSAVPEPTQTNKPNQKPNWRA